jgi:hypothetical protein
LIYAAQLVQAGHPPSAAEPRPASDAEPPLHCLVLLPILHRSPDKERADENDWNEQQHEHDHYDGGVHTSFCPPPALLLSGDESESGGAQIEH